LKPSATADFSRYDTRRNADAMSIDGPSETPESGPKIAEATMSPPRQTTAVQQMQTVMSTNSVNNSNNDVMKSQPPVTNDAPAETTQPLAQPQASVDPIPRPSTATGWMGWFGRSAPPEPPQSQPEMAVLEDPAKVEAQPQTIPDPAPKVLAQEQAASAPETSWFSFWASKNANTEQPTVDTTKQDPPPVPVLPDTVDTVMEDAPPIDTIPDPPPKAGSTWAFWSRDPGPKSDGKTSTQQEAGQLAVIGESSESHPKRSISMEIPETPLKQTSAKTPSKQDQAKTPVPPSSQKEGTSKKSKRLRPQSMEIDDPGASRPSTPKPDPGAKADAKADASPKAGSSKASTTSKVTPPNLLLPSFNSTYRMKENPSIIKQIAQLLLRTKQPPANHVFLSKDMPKIKNAIAIGVHGLFPAAYLRPMIGQPTGTSIKFANHCAEAIRRWANKNGCENCEIEKIALEGEGKIGERVENLWKLLLNWIDHIRKADLIILACHSQGVPVGIMLLAKLIELGIITNARIGVCAMGQSSWFLSCPRLRLSS
jgi:hypothetical protein